MAGSRTPQARIVAGLAREFDGREESTVISYRNKTSCLCAALANGVMARFLLFDDAHTGGHFHPGCSVIAAALAMAEREDASGKDFITAVIAGYDISIRIGVAVSPWHRAYNYLYPTGTLNCFGAAASSGKILNLDEGKMTYSLGLAGSQASGLRQCQEDHVDIATCGFYGGRSAMSGVLASLLAQRGHTGPPEILEGKYGFCRVLSKEYAPSKLTEGLGQSFKIVETGIKPYPSCGNTHSGISAILKLAEEHKLRPVEIAKVRVKTCDRIAEQCNRPLYSTVDEAIFSYQYNLALALIEGRVSIEDFTPEKVKDQGIRELAQRVEIVADPRLTSLWPDSVPAVVQVTTKTGEKYESRVAYPPGNPKNPMTHEALMHKFKSLASTLLGNAEVDQLVRTVNQLEKAGSIGELTELLAL